MSDFHLPSFSSLIFWKVSHFLEFQIFPSLQFSSLINFYVEPKSKPSTKMTNQKYVVQDTRPKVKQQREDGEMVTIERMYDGGGGRSLLASHQRHHGAQSPSHYLQNIPGLNMNLAANDPNVRTIKQHYYPEGGWGWITIAVASFVHFMTANFFPSPGLLSIQVMDTFNPDQGIVAAGKKILLPSVNSLNPFSVFSFPILSMLTGCRYQHNMRVCVIQMPVMSGTNSCWVHFSFDYLLDFFLPPF